jgi:dynein intermediate chain
VTYEQEVQTDIAGALDKELLLGGVACGPGAGDAAADDDDMKQRVARVRDLEASNADLRRKAHGLQSQLSEAAAKADALEARLHPPAAGAAGGPPLLTPEAEAAVVASEAFKTSVSRSLRLLERTLWTDAAAGAGAAAAAAAAAAASVDYAADTAADAGSRSALAASVVSTAAVLHLPKLTRARAVSTLAWSQAHPELLAAGYGSLDDPLAREPDGLVLVWNRFVPTRPEFELRCESAVTCLAFNPGAARQVVAGTASGQVLVWDFRAPAAPVARSSVASGHTFPIVALALVPHANGEYAAVSVSSDGRVCVWSLTDMHEPLSSYRIDAPPSPAAAAAAGAGAPAAGQAVLASAGVKAGELCVTAVGFPSRDSPQTLLAGTEEGVLALSRQKGETAGAQAAWPALSRGAPVSAVAFNAYDRQRGLQSDLCLVAGFDWRVTLCALSQTGAAGAPATQTLLSLQTARDAVVGAEWSPVHPAVFAVADAAGRLDVFDLLADTEAPVASFTVRQRLGETAPAAAAAAAEAAAVGSDAANAMAAALGLGPSMGAAGAAAAAAVTEGGALSVNRLQWSTDGAYIAVGTCCGALHVLAAPASVAKAPADAAERFAAVRHRLVLGHGTETATADAVERKDEDGLPE